MGHTYRIIIPLFKQGEMKMRKNFGVLADGKTAFLYTIRSGEMTAEISDLGATLVKLFVPDDAGVLADVVLGFDEPQKYVESGTFFGAVVGRNANRIKGASFMLDDTKVRLTPNEGENNLHSGPNSFHLRMWDVVQVSDHAITFHLFSPKGDQGFPGNAVIRVTYALEETNTLCITYEAVSDRDTVFNFTNHSYFVG